MWQCENICQICHIHIPKIPTMAGCLVNLQAFCCPLPQERLHLLCPVQALSTYAHCLSMWHMSSSLLVCFGSGKKVNPYEVCGMSSPLGISANSTRNMASSSDLMK